MRLRRLPAQRSLAAIQTNTAFRSKFSFVESAPWHCRQNAQYRKAGGCLRNLNWLGLAGRGGDAVADVVDSGRETLCKDTQDLVIRKPGREREKALNRRTKREQLLTEFLRGCLSCWARNRRCGSALLITAPITGEFLRVCVNQRGLGWNAEIDNQGKLHLYGESNQRGGGMRND